MFSRLEAREQELVLSPLFSIYINDLDEHVAGKNSQFVDDTKIVGSGEYYLISQSDQE